MILWKWNLYFFVLNSKLKFQTFLSDKDRLLKPTLDLLNSRLVDSFDVPRVLEMIPSNWSMKLTGDFLLNVLNSTLRRKHNNLVQKSIANNYTIHLQAELQELKKEQLYVDDDRLLKS